MNSGLVYIELKSKEKMCLNYMALWTNIITGENN